MRLFLGANMKVKKLFTLITILLLIITGSIAIAGLGGNTGVALIIGNADYIDGGELKNPENDAIAIANALSQVGFVVTLKQNLTKEQMLETITEFKNSISKNDVAFVYFSGYGAKEDNKSYLLPTDYGVIGESSSDYETTSISMYQIIKTLAESSSRLNILAMDMYGCDASFPVESVVMPASSGSGWPSTNINRAVISGEFLIACASLPAQSPLDGNINEPYQQNSPYAHALESIILDKGLSFVEAFSKLSAQVYSDTDGAQMPWFSSNIMNWEDGFSESRQSITK